MSFDLPYPDLAQERLGNTGTPGVWHVDSGLPGRTVMVTSLVHGNELCGAWALKTLLSSGLRPRRGAWILAFCNLDGYDHFDLQRPDASRYLDEDLNRVWLDERLAAAGNRERRRAAELLPWVKRADWLLDLHSMHEPSKPLLLTGVLPRNIALARTLAAPEHVIVDAGHKDGVRLRDYGRFGDPGDDACALLIECGYHGDPDARWVAVDMVARMLREAGVLDADQIPQDWLRPDPLAQRVLEVTDAVVAPSMDVRFAQDWQGLECLSKAGALIGWADGQPITTPYDNCTLVMPSLRQLRPGVTVVRLARDYSPLPQAQAAAAS
ncbi:succinylglutamate desuccinylase/aspartoacylase family protein [Pusillimonas sp. SM2304]|uniref:succinylglutamate desuccinylase/aspartoacylase domain-containing protein n=1 Tax=Pusillimonas sp. SM2304 TaxID=3073241 RepID=UPI002875155B|nr:succinylglutamate desuccinylase/aspartoacylase family protein [Pusillimonas sp. SM2304]MDS1139699.1 succinylglutamate desuccinylase/aspartoacylase family protein [Pusillimonas sp. SM2304]